MKKKTVKPKIVGKLSVRDTFLSMAVGQSSIFPTALIKSRRAAMAATRLKSAGLGTWSISEKDLTNEILVTRVG